MLNPPATVLTGFIALVAAAHLFGTDSPEKTAGLVATEPGIWSAQEVGNGHWCMTIWALDADQFTWEDAGQQCKDMGAHLVRIASREQERFLKLTLRRFGRQGWGRSDINKDGVTDVDDVLLVLSKWNEKL